MSYIEKSCTNSTTARTHDRVSLALFYIFAPELLSVFFLQVATDECEIPSPLHVLFRAAKSAAFTHTSPEPYAATAYSNGRLLLRFLSLFPPPTVIGISFLVKAASTPEGGGEFQEKEREGETHFPSHPAVRLLPEQPVELFEHPKRLSVEDCWR